MKTLPLLYLLLHRAVSSPAHNQTPLFTNEQPSASQTPSLPVLEHPVLEYTSCRAAHDPLCCGLEGSQGTEQHICDSSGLCHDKPDNTDQGDNDIYWRDSCAGLDWDSAICLRLCYNFGTGQVVEHVVRVTRKEFTAKVP